MRRTSLLMDSTRAADRTTTSWWSWSRRPPWRWSTWGSSCASSWSARAGRGCWSTSRGRTTTRRRGSSSSWWSTPPSLPTRTVPDRELPQLHAERELVGVDLHVGRHQPLRLVRGGHLLRLHEPDGKKWLNHIKPSFFLVKNHFWSLKWPCVLLNSS